ncbi:pentapeptide repeat-containing protein, partial [Roseomonas mucosa]
MRPALPILLALFLLAVAAPARAACNDLPAPGVDWRRCLLDGRDLPDADLAGAVLRDASFSRANMVGAV